MRDPLEMNDLSNDPNREKVIKRLFKHLLKLQKVNGDPLDLKTAFPKLD